MVLIFAVRLYLAGEKIFNTTIIEAGFRRFSSGWVTIIAKKLYLCELFNMIIISLN